MDQIDSIIPEESAGHAAAGRPRLLDWIWRPWYAKLWWAAITVFWSAALIVSWLGIQRLPIDASVLLYVAMVLHPQAALPVLGFGYARAFLKRYRDLGNTSAGGDEAEDGRDDFPHGLFGRDRFMSYLSDPSDPRSPLNSLNPANWRYLNQPDR